ncbi:protein toll isoform X1 [Diabrotica virgifera virgifera]|uniref:TIR domain-containing protein n=1 Tax=Diabrotica virgifera virgifera TaxID=50390 RepID=A0ABM5KI28_DIAVI|nr:protein toll isoform X1 [Diabrotica virgifera virgifera]
MHISSSFGLIRARADPGPIFGRGHELFWGEVPEIKMVPLTIVLLMLGTFLRVRGDQCEDVDRTKCVCYPGTDYEYQCPPASPESYLIHAQPREYLHIDCYGIKNFDVDRLPNYVAGNTTYIRMRYCPWPEENFQALLEKFGITFVKSLYFDELFLPNSSAPIVSKSTFQGLPHLRVLTLARVSNKLADDLLTDLPELAEFYLESSKAIKELPDFYIPSTVKILHLVKNQFTKVPKNVFQNLTGLRQLHLWRNNITSITRDDFKVLKQLGSLELSINSISDIEEDCFADLTELKTINLGHNKLSNLHPSIFKYNTKLASIRLEHNPFLILPERIFAGFPDLSNISIRNTGTAILTEDIFANSSQITVLGLHENKLQELSPNVFKGLKKLKTLDLSKNQIKSLPDSLFSDSLALDMLNLDFNSITKISNELFSTTKNLSTLTIRHNNLNYIETRAFVQLDQLRTLDLSYNQLTLVYIPGQSPIPALLSLESLILRNNQIKDFPDLGHLQYLQNVDVSFNQLQILRIEDLVVNTRQSLGFVDLQNNKIQEVDFGTLNITMSNTELQYKLIERFSPNNKYLQMKVDLRKNPILCDCSVYNLVRYYQNDMYPAVRSRIDLNINGIVCDKSTLFQDVLVTHLKPDDISCEVSSISCPKKCFCLWHYHSDSVHVNCSNRNLTQFPTLTIRDNKIKLDLDGNYIEGGLNSSMGYDNVTELILSNNRIHDLKWIPMGIEKLNLQHNSLTHIDSELFKIINSTKSLNKLELAYNPWSCGCSAFDLQLFLQNRYTIVNSTDVFCQKEKQYLVKKADLCKTSSALILSIVFPIVAFLILTIVTLVLYIYYRQEVKVWLYAKNICLWFVTEEELDEDKEYDVFLSYAHQDEEFVLHNLLPVLQPLRTCIHIRDWKPGETILTNVEYSVMNSRRTLVVLSNNFLDSVWGIQEFKTAHTQAIKEGRARVIVVKYGELDKSRLDVDIGAYLNTNTYVEWGKPWFWNKLNYALPHRRENGFCKSNQKHASIMLKIDDKFVLTNPPVNHAESTPPVITLDPAVLKNHPLNFQKGSDLHISSSETPLVVSV